MYGFFVQGIEQNPLDRFPIPKIFQQLIHEQLAFPVRITCINNNVRFTGQGLDHLELLPGIFPNFELPDVRNNRQQIQAAALILFVIILRHEVFQEMTIFPSDDIISDFDISILSGTLAKAFGYLTGHGRFLRYE